MLVYRVTRCGRFCDWYGIHIHVSVTTIWSVQVLSSRMVRGADMVWYLSYLKGKSAVINWENELYTNRFSQSLECITRLRYLESSIYCCAFNKSHGTEQGLRWLEVTPVHEPYQRMPTLHQTLFPGGFDNRSLAAILKRHMQRQISLVFSQASLQDEPPRTRLNLEIQGFTIILYSGAIITIEFIIHKRH